MNVVTEKRKSQARKHASRTRTCPCGKVCRGNGGWSSHKRACAVWKAASAAGQSRSQRLREKGFTRRPTWRSLPKDGDAASDKETGDSNE